MIKQDPPISKIYDYGNLIVEKVKHLRYEETQPKPTVEIVCPTALVGIEMEVENIRSDVPITHYWMHKEDGSLRNYGAEFTSIPLRGYQVPYALDHLEKCIRMHNNPDFSTRTSVHVHLNVRDMSENQIRVFILLYALFERHFFNFAGTKRETSVFCVPLYRTNQLADTIKRELIRISNYWHKYSAINCGTILGNGDVPKFGTIEFRHLYGTLDKTVIIDWINQIFLLRTASHQYEYEDLVKRIEHMNTTSEYALLYKSIFGKYARLDLMSKKDFEHCVTMTKLALFGENYSKKVGGVKPGSALSMWYQEKRKGNMYKVKTLTTEELVTVYDQLVGEPQAMEVNAVQKLQNFLNAPIEPPVFAHAPPPIQAAPKAVKKPNTKPPVKFQWGVA